MRSLFSTLAAAVFLAGSVATPGSAQDRALVEQLQQAKRIDCLFTRRTKGNWNNDSTEFDSEVVEYEASFYDIDVEGGTAEVEGRFGASYIIVRYAQGYLHFMQTLSSGPLYLTTVLAEPSTAGRLKAVHTRHEYTAVSLPNFTSRPEMYLGDCSIETAQN